MNTTSAESAISIRREHLHRRGVRLEWFTVSWNVIETFIAIGGPHCGEPPHLSRSALTA